MKTILLLLSFMLVVTASAETRIVWRNNTTNIMYVRSQAEGYYYRQGDIAIAPVSEAESRILTTPEDEDNQMTFEFSVGSDFVGWIVVEPLAGLNSYVSMPDETAWSEGVVVIHEYPLPLDPLVPFSRGFGLGCLWFLSGVVIRMVGNIGKASPDI